jgi:IS30 family transposase
MTYKHLSQEERYQIYILMSAGNSQQQIAELLGRHKSTISREIARNMAVEVIDLDKPVYWLRNGH